MVDFISFSSYYLDMMTKKDYKLIADCVVESLKDSNSLGTFLSYLRKRLEKDNPKFNFLKFEEYIFKQYKNVNKNNS